jgi:hypothetical protein
MKHLFIKVSAVEVLDGCSLRVHFENGTVRDINLEPVLYGELYEPLRNRALFIQVSVDNEVGTIVWPNGADFDPDLLYCWDEHIEAFTNQMSKIGSADHNVSACI